MFGQLIMLYQEVNYTIAWRKQAEKWAIKAIKTQLSAFEIKYNSQILQDKIRN